MNCTTPTRDDKSSRRYHFAGCRHNPDIDIIAQTTTCGVLPQRVTLQIATSIAFFAVWINAIDQAAGDRLV